MLAKLIGILLIILGALMAVSIFQVSKALIAGGYGSTEDALIKGGFLLVMALIALFMVKKGVDACRTQKVKAAGDEAKKT